MTLTETITKERETLTRTKCQNCSVATRSCDHWCPTYRRFNELQLRLARAERAEQEAA